MHAMKLKKREPNSNFDGVEIFSKKEIYLFTLTFIGF